MNTACNNHKDRKQIKGFVYHKQQEKAIADKSMYMETLPFVPQKAMRDMISLCFQSTMERNKK